MNYSELTDKKVIATSLIVGVLAFCFLNFVVEPFVIKTLCEHIVICEDK